MPTSPGIIDDCYNTVALRKARSEAAALKRITAQIIAEPARLPPPPLPVIPYARTPSQSQKDEAAAARLRKTVHAIVDKMLGIK